MKWFTKKQNPSLGSDVLVFDFGSGSVKILRCRYTLESLEILDGTKIRYGSAGTEVENPLDDSRFQGEFAEKVQKIIPEETKISKAVIGLAGPDVEGYTSQITYRRAHSDMPIKEQEFGAILKRVEERADQLMRKMIDWETAEDSAIRLVNSEVLEITLDGYAVTSPVGSTGTKLSFTVYNGYAKEKFVSAAVALVKRAGLSVVTVVPTMYSMVRAACVTLGPDSSVCVIDVGQSATEVGIVLSGRILGHSSFEVAGSSFTRTISETLHKPYDEAELLKLGFSGGKLPQNLMDEVHEVVANDCKVFISGVELLLNEFPGCKQLPAQFYLTGGGSLLTGLLSSVQAAEWNGQLSRPRTIRAQHAEPKLFSGYQDKTGELRSASDVGPLSVALDASDLFQTDL